MRNDYKFWKLDKIISPQSWPAQSIGFLEHKGRKGGYRYRPEAHVGHELIYVDYGRVRLELADRREMLKAGEAMVIPAKTRHSICSDGEGAFSFLNVLFRGRRMKNVFGRVLGLSPKRRQTLTEIKNEGVNRFEHYREILLMKFNLFLLEWDREESQTILHASPMGENEWRHRETVVMRALTFLQAQVARPLDAEEVSRRAGVSPSYLRRLVRQGTGQTLSEHLKRLRVEAAKQMLMETDANIEEIARRVGYNSPSHFCTVFRKVSGMTAGQYARSLGAPEGNTPD